MIAFIALVIAITVVVGYIAWKNIKWEEFTINKGEIEISSRPTLFYGCYFHANEHKQNITGILRELQRKYGKVVLFEPLNGLSFVIPGVNDRKTLATPLAAKKWAHAAQVAIKGWRAYLTEPDKDAS